MQAPERVVVRFEGDGAGEGPLSWGQAENWHAIQRQRSWLPLGGIQPLPPGSTVDGVAGELRYLLSRFPSLRTRLRLTDGERPVQVVAGAGEITLEVFDAGDRDAGTVAGEVHVRYRDTDLDFTAEWPVRMAAVRSGGALTHLVALLSHFALDATGAAVMLAGVATRDTAPLTGRQPLAQADWQRSPAGRRHNAAALRHWEGILRTLAPRRFADPVVRTSPRYWQGEFTSPELHRAVRAIVRRTGVGSSTVLVALYAGSLARVSGVGLVAIRPTVSNRFRAGLSDVVCTLVQAGLLMLDVAGATFDELLERTRRVTLPAYKYAYFDPDDVAALRDRVAGERGAAVDIGCFYNDRRGPDRERDLDAPEPTPAVAEPTPAVAEPTPAVAEPTPAVAEPTPAVAEPTPAVAEPMPAVAGLRWVSKQDTPAVEPLFVHVDDAAGTMRLTIQLDADYLAPGDGEAVLRGMESLAVAAAAGPVS